MQTQVRDSFLMGTENGPEGSKKTAEFTLWIGCNPLTLRNNADIQAFATWVAESQNLMADIANQSHAWTTPSSDPNLFTSYEEELAEIADWANKGKK